MSGFNIKKAPADFELKRDSLDSYLDKEERPDYSEVPCEKLSDDDVPVLYILPSAFSEINEHICWKKRTRANLCEQGGILVGNVFKDNDTKIVCGVVQHIIPSTKSGDATYIQFTHDDWILMYKEFEDKYFHAEEQESQLKVIGWYHTHPNMPVNMSAIDKSTHAVFFSEKWQFSVIFNPQRGKWAVFNGIECKNCNGYIYCLASENDDSGNISEDYDQTQSEIPMQSEQRQTTTRNRPFVVKRRSEVSQSNSRNNAYSAQQACHTGSNTSTFSKTLMLQRYKGMVLPIRNNCYYCPLNKIKGEKGLVISDSLVRKFVSYIDDWSFENDESIAFIYHLNETKIFIKEVSGVKYYSFNVSNDFSTDRFIFISAVDEYFEYLYHDKFQNEKSLVVVYTAVCPTYTELCKLYGNYSCVLWINPQDFNEFQFYFFESNTKATKNDFNIRNADIFETKQRMAVQTVRIGGNELLKDLLNSWSVYSDAYSWEDSRYLKTEYDGISYKKPPLFMSKNLLKNFFCKINRYSIIKSDFIVIISYKTSSSLSQNRTIVNPWGNEFSSVWILKGDIHHKIIGCSMKGADKGGCGMKVSKFALVISNTDVDIDILKHKLIGHMTAVCLNIENQSCHFYQLF